MSSRSCEIDSSFLVILVPLQEVWPSIFRMASAHQDCGRPFSVPRVDTPTARFASAASSMAGQGGFMAQVQVERRGVGREAVVLVSSAAVSSAPRELRGAVVLRSSVAPAYSFWNEVRTDV